MWIIQLLRIYVLLFFVSCSAKKTTAKPESNANNQICITQVELFRLDVPSPDVLRFYLKVKDKGWHEKIKDLHLHFSELYFEPYSDTRNHSGMYIVRVYEVSDDELIMYFPTQEFVIKEEDFYELQQRPKIRVKEIGTDYFTEISRCN